MNRADIAKQSLKRRQRRDNMEGLLFACPPVIRFLLFTLVPMFVGLVVAFCDTGNSYDVLASEFCGLNNFKEVLTDPVFWESVKNTFILALAWPISMLCALVISVFMAGEIKAKPFFPSSILFAVCMFNGSSYFYMASSFRLPLWSC